MNKGLAILTISMMPMLASATEVDLYGKVYVELFDVDIDASGSGDGTELGDDFGRSRVGVSFKHPVNDNLNVVANAEFNYDPTEAGDGFSDRQAYVGLAGAWGEIAAGRFHGSYKTFGGAGYDPFNDSALQVTGKGGLSAGAFNSGGFLERMIQYRTPESSPIELQVQIGVSDNRGTNAGFGVPTESSDGDYNIGARYQHERFELIAAASHDDDADDAGLGSDNIKIGGSFKVNDEVAVYLQFEDVETDGSKIGGEGDTTFLSLRYTPNNWLWDFSYGSSESDLANNDIDFLRIAGIYSLSDKANVQFGYTTSDIDGAGDLDFLVFGFEYNFDFSYRR